MSQTLTQPPLTAIPEDIEDQLRHLLQTPHEPAKGEWLLELMKNSGHLTTADHLGWRVISAIWMAAEFDTDAAWPYLMWFNMNEPVMSDHLEDILTEAVDDMECHIQLANWIAKATDERLVTFFSNYGHIPAARKMAPLLSRLLTNPQAPETGVWLAAFCRDTADNPSPYMRPWRLLAATWHATCFNPTEGLAYLQKLSGSEKTLSPDDNRLLTDAANEINGTPAIIQWIADCSDPAIRTILKEFGHPDLLAFTEAIFQEPPDYGYLTNWATHAVEDAETFKRHRALLEEAGISSKGIKILDLACGPLAPQTLLFNSIGYKTLGVGLHIPPAYLSPASIKQRLNRGKYVKAWKAATDSYYQTLAQETGLKFRWNKVKIEMADLTRLQFSDNGFAVVICVNHLQHAPDVDSLLAEAARVLEPGGLFLADIRPFPSLTGAFDASESQPAWGHLRENNGAVHHNSSPMLNKWREAQYQAAFGKYFILEQWFVEPDEQASARLTPEIRAELVHYSQEELTRKQIVVVAKKKA